MSCQFFSQQIEAFVQGGLGDAGVRALAGHLKDCPSCAALARQERRLHELLGAAPIAEPSPHLEASFLRRFRDEVRRESRTEAERSSWWTRLFGGYRWTAWASGVAAALVVLTLAWPGMETAPPNGTPRGAPPEVEVSRELLSKIELLQNLDVATHLDALIEVTPEELDAIAELPELGG